ncbi:MAG: cyanophycin synthetase [Thermoleophilia bacterium]
MPPADAHTAQPGREGLSGRRLYFVGIGGSGMSAYANMARARGAEVRGWDVGDTIFMASLEGIEVDLGDEPSPPEGWEVVVSTAHTRRAEGTSRGAFLAELVAVAPAIVVGGAHGKTTTAAMIAYVLRETGRDPAWIIGGIVPQLGGNAGMGSGWLVVEGDESDRSIGSLTPQIAVVTNIELDHHAAYASEAELTAFFDHWLEGIPHVVRSWELPPVELVLSVPGDHNRQNAAAALAALELAGVPRVEAEAAIVRFTGVGRRFELVRAHGGVVVYDDYGHNPTELEVTLQTARSLTAGRVIAVYQPHVVERTRQLHVELGAALGLADVAIVTDIIGARDTPREGVTGKLVVDSLPPCVRAGWAPSPADAVALALAWVRPGDLVITFGVGEPWKMARAIADGLPG